MELYWPRRQYYLSADEAELKGFTTSIGADNGEHITFDVKKAPFSSALCVRRTVGSQTRDTDENGLPSNVLIETEV